jgi:hypothetical protein
MLIAQLTAMQFAVTADAQRYLVGVVITAASGARHKVMVLQVLGIGIATRDTER